MAASASSLEATGWLLEHGPRKLEPLLRAIVFPTSVPLLLADSLRRLVEASVGSCQALAVPRERLVGRPLDDFVQPEFKPQISPLWQTFLEQGEQAGTLPLMGANGARDFGYIAKDSVLPQQHLVILREKVPAEGSIPSALRDFALYLLDKDGNIAAWYSGAARMFGYQASEAIGQPVSILYAPAGKGERYVSVALREELKRAEAEDHFGAEYSKARKDGSTFWANVITVALRDGKGELQGFARLARDFSDVREEDKKLQGSRARHRLEPADSAVAGIVFGEFEQISDANDVFLNMLGYTREDLTTDRINWLALSPPEYAAVDGCAHEEGLRFRACAPFEKELIGKSGIRVPVLVVTAVLGISPFRWITFVHDLRDRDRFERIDEADAGLERDFAEMVGSSAALKRILRQVEMVAPTDATVLILGETGTGKELVARAIHRMSPRKNSPWITLNCAAIPTGLLESELFGYERGAFTGALSQKIGRFEMAHKGTLFLDEVGDIPLELQPKLLRALQEKSFERLGGTKTIPIDVRLVAATNRNLAQMMGDKLFRPDLYYRLKVFPITVPPLRDRPEDIPVLARHFTKKYAAKMNRQLDKIPAATMQALVNWHWPGNVRELENFIERAVILSRGPSLRAPLAEIRKEPLSSAGVTLDQIEREHIIRIFRESGGVVTTTATRLGLHRTTLNAMMRRLGLSRNDL